MSLQFCSCAGRTRLLSNCGKTINILSYLSIMQDHYMVRTAYSFKICSDPMMFVYIKTAIALQRVDAGVRRPA